MKKRNYSLFFKINFLLSITICIILFALEEFLLFYKFSIPYILGIIGSYLSYKYIYKPSNTTQISRKAIIYLILCILIPIIISIISVYALKYDSRSNIGKTIILSSFAIGAILSLIIMIRQHNCDNKKI